jgi:dihydroorotate dehydrogenase electron transfer subunit
LTGRIVAEVVARRSFGRCAELVLEVPASFKAEPGQFIHIYCGAPGLILRRPFSLFDVRDGKASLLVREVGSGSAWLSNRDVGDKLDFLGPLGRGFRMKDGESKNLLLAGGTGIAPLRFLAAEMRDRDIEATVFWGMESEDEFRGLARRLEGECELRLATIDGGKGFEGSVIGLFKTYGKDEYNCMYACGPRGMLAALAETIDKNEIAALQVSLEERMACGVGACRGCVVPAAEPDGGYLTACKDGPVFFGSELDWRRI